MASRRWGASWWDLSRSPDLCCFRQELSCGALKHLLRYSDSVKKGFALVSGIVPLAACSAAVNFCPLHTVLSLRLPCTCKVLTTLAQAVLEDAPLTVWHVTAADAWHHQTLVAAALEKGFSSRIQAVKHPLLHPNGVGVPTAAFLTTRMSRSWLPSPPFCTLSFLQCSCRRRKASETNQIWKVQALT